MAEVRRRAARPWSSPTSFDEAFRILATNLRSALSDAPSPSLMVTSARAGEGRTTTAVKVAAALASAGSRVVLVDLDLRRPGCHTLLGHPAEPGFTSVVTGDHRLGDCLRPVPVTAPPGAHARLYALASGGPVTSPSDVLRLPRTARLLDRLAAEADVVVVDAPPVLPVADALVIGPLVGAALLVVDPRRTGASAVERSRDLLTRNDTRLLGVAVNQVRPGDATAYDRYGLVSS